VGSSARHGQHFADTGAGESRPDPSRPSPRSGEGVTGPLPALPAERGGRDSYSLPTEWGGLGWGLQPAAQSRRSQIAASDAASGLPGSGVWA